MSDLEELAACAGSWRGTNRLEDPHNNLAEDSPATATVTPVLDGRFVRLDYTWSYKGKPQEGSLLVGSDPKEGTVDAALIDTWHMGRKMMACQGPADGGGTLSVRGSYAAPPGPDWGWRIDVIPKDGQTLRMVMFNIWPEGKEELAVEASYARASEERGLR